MRVYLTMLFLHVLGVIVFSVGHGTAVAVAFRLKKETENSRMAALLDVSGWSSSLMYLGLLLMIGTGVALGFMGSFWGDLWLWLSISILVVVLASMYMIATPHFARLRVLVGAHAPESVRAKVLASGVTRETLGGGWRAMTLTLLGGIGLAVVLWLMMAKPF